MRVLVLAANYRNAKAWGHETFLDEVARQHTVVRPANPRGLDVPAFTDEHGPFDVVLVQHLQFSDEYRGLGIVGAVTVCLVEDYFPRHITLKNTLLSKHEFDMVFLSQRSFVTAAETLRYCHQLPDDQRYAWLPFSVDPDTFFAPCLEQRRFAASFVACDHPFEYPNRRAVAESLALRDTTYGERFVRLTPNPIGVECPKGVVFQREYADLLRVSRVGVASIDRHGSCNLRHFEIPLAGSVLLTDGPPNDFAALGFVEDVHYVKYSGVNEMLDKLRYLAEWPDVASEIALAGQRLVAGNHTHRVRVKQMFDEIRKTFLGGDDV